MARVTTQGTKTIRARLRGIVRGARLAAAAAGVAAVLLAAGYALDHYARRGQTESDNLLYLVDGNRRPLLPAEQPEEPAEPPTEYSFFETLTSDKIPEDLETGHQQRLREVQRRPAAQPKPIPILTEAPGGEAPQSADEVVYTIQLGSFQHAQGARDFSERLAEKGYEPYIIKITVPGKGAVYRVRMGRLKNIEEAQKVASEFEQKEKMSVLITSR